MLLAPRLDACLSCLADSETAGKKRAWSSDEEGESNSAYLIAKRNARSAVVIRSHYASPPVSQALLLLAGTANGLRKQR